MCPHEWPHIEGSFSFSVKIETITNLLCFLLLGKLFYLHFWLSCCIGMVYNRHLGTMQQHSTFYAKKKKKGGGEKEKKYDSIVNSVYGV